MACSCWAGGKADGSSDEMAVAAVADTVEAIDAVELTARQRRIIEGSKGSSCRDNDDDDVDDARVFDDASALKLWPVVWDTDGAGAREEKEGGKELAWASGLTCAVAAAAADDTAALSAKFPVRQNYVQQLEFKNMRKL